MLTSEELLRGTSVGRFLATAGTGAGARFLVAVALVLSEPSAKAEANDAGALCAATTGCEPALLAIGF